LSISIKTELFWGVAKVYRRKDERVRAHLFVAALTVLLDRALEKQLRAAGSDLSRRQLGGAGNHPLRGSGLGLGP
jgi:transposase